MQKTVAGPTSYNRNHLPSRENKICNLVDKCVLLSTWYPVCGCVREKGSEGGEGLGE